MRFRPGSPGIVEQAFDRARDEALRWSHGCAQKYIDEFLRLKCAPDLIRLRLYPNMKEITESMGAYAAVRRHLGDELFGDRAVRLAAVGDGCTPRTAALFAHRSRWDCWSVDPNLRGDWAAVERLRIFPGKVEDFSVRSTWSGRAVVVAVHSHAPLQEALHCFPDATRLDVVAISCCVLQELRRDHRAGGAILKPDWDFDDFAIASPKRRVTVWTDVLPKIGAGA